MFKKKCRGRNERASTALLALFLMFAAGMTGILAGCENGNGSGKTLVFGSEDYQAINPALYEEREIDSLIFSGLTAHSKTGGVVPDLAERWEFSPTDNVYTFYLRKDVKWQDGKPFTAKDVRFTLEAIMDPSSGSELASNFSDVAGVDVVDDYTVRIAMAAPSPALLEYLTVGILPAHLLEGEDLTDDWFVQRPIGTGPFTLKKWEQGECITLERNQKYYGEAPKLDTVIFRIVPNLNERAKLLKDGELDAAQIPPAVLAEFAAADSGFTAAAIQAADYRGLLYNFNSPLFSENPELPEALSYGFDRQRMLDEILMGYGEIAYSPLQRSRWNQPEVERFEYHPQKSAELLETAGWEKASDGVYEKNGTRLAFEIHCLKDDVLQVRLAEFCAEDLQKIGVEVTVKEDDEIDWIEPAAWIVEQGSPFDPDDAAYKRFVTNQLGNRGSYSNDKVDALLSEARERELAEQRLSLYQAFQEELSRDLPMSFLVYSDAIYAVRNGVSGLDSRLALGHGGEGILRNILEWDVEE